MSVSKLTKQLKCSVCFFPDHVIIQDLKTKKTIGEGRESNGMYYFDGLQSSVACPVSASPLLIHSRLDHPSLENLKKLVPNLNSTSTLECESCQLGKHHRALYLSRVNKRVDKPFSLIHTDSWGPSRTKSKLGFQYFIIFVDDFSRMTWLYLMKDRSELFSIFCAFCAEIQNQFHTRINILRSDNAKEYFSNSISSYMQQQGILHQSSCPHTSQQNGVAERKIQHIVETARTLLIHMNVPKSFWGDAVLTACFLINRLPSSILAGKIPFSILFPRQAPFPVIPRIFGCVCFVHQNQPGTDKLDPKSLKCVFLGYSRLQKGYKCFSPSLNRCFVSADVTFFEATPYFSDTQFVSSDTDDCLPLPSVPVQMAPTNIDVPVTDHVPSELIPNNNLAPSERLSRPDLQVYTRRSHQEALPQDSRSSPPASSSTPPADDLEIPIALRKGKRSCTLHPISNVISYNSLSPSYSAFISTLSSIPLPKSISEALSHPGWKQAMEEEMSALWANNTWDLVPLPHDQTVVGCRWVFNVKVHPNGTVDRLKARLVAKGYTQVYGMDYLETFSPVAKMTSVRVVIALAATNQWPLHQLDVKNAFLHGDLEETIFMEQPPGFVAQGETDLVCRLNKSLYGLKQSPRAWFGRFSAVVVEFGLQQCGVDHSVFYGHSRAGKIILIVYVDDIVITGDDNVGIQSLKSFLQTKFQTKDLGSLRYFLGIEVARSKMGINLSQRKYVLDLLEETGLLGAKSVDSPMEPNVKLDAEKGEYLGDPSRYRRLVGKLNYLTVTRPDISFATSVVSQFMESPRTGHWDAVIRILRYLKGTPGRGLLYRNYGHIQIQGYTDADWAGSYDRRSTSGYCVFMGGNLVSWKSKKQTVVARSSAESEYRAMAYATCELVWLKHLLQELGFEHSSPMELMCDNQAATHIASNPVFHERTKHIEVDCHFVREKLQEGLIKTPYVKSEDQLADLFTKSLRGSRVNFICSKLGAYDIYAPA